MIGNETLLSGSLPDQAALHGLLERIRDLNLTSTSVTSDGPSSQDSEKEKGEAFPGADVLVILKI